MHPLKPFIAALLTALTFSTSAQTPPAEPVKPNASNQASGCPDSQGKCESTKELNRMQKNFIKACEKDPEACQYRHEKARERREAMAKDNAPQN
jgi:hypothetical protein